MVSRVANEVTRIKDESRGVVNLTVIRDPSFQEVLDVFV